MNPLRELRDLGLSIWVEPVGRGAIASGELRRLVEEDGVAGAVWTPSAFAAALTATSDYLPLLREIPAEPRPEPRETFERLMIRDVRDAADVLRAVWEGSGGADGFVCVEATTGAAADPDILFAETRRLWRRIERANVLVRVPGTPAGITAVERLVEAGIAVDLAPLYCPDAYAQAAGAYLRGIEAFGRRGADLKRIAATAGYVLGPVDARIESLVARRPPGRRSSQEDTLLGRIRGRVAPACARLTCEVQRGVFRGERWERLEAAGGRILRLRWEMSAPAGDEKDLSRLEAVIRPGTILTLSPAALAAVRNSAGLRPARDDDPADAQDIMDALGQLDIPVERIAERLLQDDLRVASESFHRSLRAVEAAHRGAAAPISPRPARSLPEPLEARVERTVREWAEGGKVKRLWERDASFWTGGDEGKWLDWLEIPAAQLRDPERFRALAESVRREGIGDVLVLGMGGSSLAVEVIARTIGRVPGFPRLRILDTTDPDQIRACDSGIDPATTLFVVSSKSGTTVEPLLLMEHFWDRTRRALGPEGAGSRFLAITDPGTPLEETARRNGFRAVHAGVPGIGGRFSALSDFGMIPAAAAGVDVRRLLSRAAGMADLCGPAARAEENPGLLLGIVLGECARQGHDKVTLVASPGIAPLGGWVEQLLAESTGKAGVGLVPVDREPAGDPGRYGRDRLFVYLRLETGPDPAQDAAVERLERAGLPVVRIRVEDVYDVGRAFFRWEFATAVAGSILGINAFDQPDVESSKAAARALTAEFEAAGSFPPERVVREDGPIRLYADRRNEADLGRDVRPPGSLGDWLRAHLDRLQVGDYFAILAFLEQREDLEAILGEIRLLVRDRRRVATSVGFGPRFLHSTGQLHKGGPNSGVFLQITRDPRADLAVPGRRVTFGAVQEAQARGDFRVLADRERRLLRVHLAGDARLGLEALRDRFREVLG